MLVSQRLSLISELHKKNAAKKKPTLSNTAQFVRIILCHGNKKNPQKLHKHNQMQLQPKKPDLPQRVQRVENFHQHLHILELSRVISATSFLYIIPNAANEQNSTPKRH